MVTARRSVVWALVVAACASVARAADRILVFGGGGSPGLNQVSLEKNVQFFQRVLKEVGLGETPQELYFADGGTAFHSVQLTAAAPGAPTFAQFVAHLVPVTDSGEIDLRYRPTVLTGIKGATTAQNLAAWMDAPAGGQALRPHDHLLFYFTGHGGAAGRNDFRGNTNMDMWGGVPLTMRGFARDLDKLDPDVEVMLVLAQCHSGGFANVIYVDGDPARGLSPCHRAGFFATIAPRLAAGCTPEINEADYQDFSTHFFAALSGKTRTGQPVTRPDYDGDGVTSYMEAFTYVLLNDDTIDIPMTTSDQLLRDMSRFREDGDQAEVLAGDAAYADVVALATPAQKAALEGLADQLNLGAGRGGPLAQAGTMAQQIERDRRRLAQQERAAQRDYESARRQVRDVLVSHYPELDIPGHPEAAKILASELPTMRKLLEPLEAYRNLEPLSRKWKELQDTDDALEVKWVKTQRLLERARTVILAANLPRVADAETVRAYAALVARENDTLRKHP